jgi:hypothetical protein
VLLFFEIVVVVIAELGFFLLDAGWEPEQVLEGCVFLSVLLGVLLGVVVVVVVDVGLRVMPDGGVFLVAVVVVAGGPEDVGL